MNSLPLDIAQEIKSFSFFREFSEGLINQAASYMSVSIIPAGTALLSENQENDALYFLRSGEVEVSLSGEVIATLRNPGEVFGEMSIITGRVASTTIKALTQTSCFVLRAKDFSSLQDQDKIRFDAVMYKIYCHILTERLIRTNEKARLFEILNRELHEAQTALEKSGGRVLLIEPDPKKQLPVRMALGGTGVQLDIAIDEEKTKELSNSHKYDIVIFSADTIHIAAELDKAKKINFGVLLTNQDIQKNLKILEQYRFVNHIVSRDEQDRNSSIRVVLTALSKLLNRDFFGIDKYLTWGMDVQYRTVNDSTQRENIRDQVYKYFKTMGVRSTVLDRVNTVAEELLMNAIYDAPVDGTGNSLFNHLSRQQEVKLDTHQSSIFQFASDGVHLAIAVRDPFGSLTKDVVVDYLLSCYGGRAGTLNDNKGGAGRGLHQIIENSDVTIFNVKGGVRTEVICLFNVDGQKKIPQPTFHYFFT